MTMCMFREEDGCLVGSPQPLVLKVLDPNPAVNLTVVSCYNNWHRVSVIIVMTTQLVASWCHFNLFPLIVSRDTELKLISEKDNTKHHYCNSRNIQ